MFKLGLFLLSLLWGCSFLYVEIIIEKYSVFTTVWLRVTIGFLFLWIILTIKEKKLFLRKHWKDYAFLGFFNNALPFSLIAFAQLEITSSLAAILNSSAPVFTLCLATICGLEKITLRKQFGLLFGILGVIAVCGWTSIFSKEFSLLHCCASAFATFGYAISAIYSRTKLSTVDFHQLSCGMLLFASLITLPFVLIYGDIWQPIYIQTAIAILALGILSTGLAYIIFFWLLLNTGPTNTMLVTFLIPVIASTLGVFFLHENFGVEETIGIILIGTSLVLVNTPTKKVNT